MLVDSSLLEHDESHDDACALAWRQLRSAHGVVVPGGFGARGVEGMVRLRVLCVVVAHVTICRRVRV
jgi:CTP synthase (UTP-ammonia lyase)